MLGAIGGEEGVCERILEEAEWLSSGGLQGQLERVVAEHLGGEGEQGVLREGLLRAVRECADRLSLRLKTTLLSSAEAIAELSQAVSESQSALREREEGAAALAEQVETLSARLGSWQGEYEALKAELSDTHDRYERRLREARREKKEIKQTFREVQQHTEIERALLEDLRLEKEEYLEQAISGEREREALRGELEEVRQKYHDSARKLEASASKLSWEEKRIAHLEQLLAEKDALIHKMREEAINTHSQEHDHHTINVKSESLLVTKSFVEDHTLPHEDPKKHVSFAEAFKLSDEILNIPEDFDLALSVKKSDDSLGINKSFSRASRLSDPDHDLPLTFTEVPHSPPAQSPRLQAPDFYLVHFLLTAQAVKIKLNSEAYLGIDLAGHYGEIVRQRVPFHTWDDWIRQKLKELAS